MGAGAIIWPVGPCQVEALQYGIWEEVLQGDGAGEGEGDEAVCKELEMAWIKVVTVVLGPSYF